MKGDAEIRKVVSLAIELIDCSMKAVDATREGYGSFRAGGYSAKEWAMDALKLLPDNRADALMIINAHTPGEADYDNRRKIGKLCRTYYRQLASTGLLNHGQRLLNKYN